MKRLILPNKETTVDAVILANGAYPSEGTIAAAILANAERVICCDGAADRFIAHGGKPAIVIGDGDSLADRSVKLIHVSDQETNDLTKAFRYCLSQRWMKVIILGATGLREDHSIANISLLTNIYACQAESVMIVSDYGVFAASSGKAVYETTPGQPVSLFASRRTKRIFAQGLRYPIPDDGLSMLWQGSLNVAAGAEVTVMSDSYVTLYRAF